ncbi:hypothetical protein ACQCLI_12765 [Pseudomonas nitroreducens]|uniref:hypothetical protein n=1 Tax=Pseudomonas nitroreducens TaxID=46680 RepID=UPI003CFFAB1E
MKNYLLASCACAFFLSAIASFEVFSADQSDDPCAWVNSYSKSIMTARQHNKSMSDLVKVVNEQDISVSAKSEIKKMIVAAYEAPVFMTEEVQNKMISEFQNKNYLQCVKAKGV